MSAYFILDDIQSGFLGKREINQITIGYSDYFIAKFLLNINLDRIFSENMF